MITINSILNQNHREIIELTAIIETALCVGAGGSSGSLADKAIVRDGKGKLIIPASQLKGRIRHECEKIARGLGWAVCASPTANTICPERAGLTGNFQRPQYHLNDNSYPESKRHHCLICQLFGNPTLPSRIIFEDLVCKESPENLPEVIRPGVTINRRRQTSEDQKLYFLETSPVNLNLQFQGNIEILPPLNWEENLHPDYAKALLIASIKKINALGGAKSTGLGWLHWEFKQLPPIAPKSWQDLMKAKVDSDLAPLSKFAGEGGMKN